MIKTATEAWLESLQNVYNNGIEYAPRNLKTREVMNEIISFDMNYPVCYHENRKLSYKFMAAEAYWIASGGMMVDEIAPYNKHIANFSDDGHIFNGPYGPMFVSQIDYVVNSLLHDNNTRQAVLTIWHPNTMRSKDYKCTIALIFNIRDDKLHTTVLMRSSDRILGLSYDMFNFTIMTLRILTYLNENAEETSEKIIGLGTQTLHAVSSHIYEDKFELVNSILNKKSNTIKSKVPNQALLSWKFITDSLIACRDMKDTTDLWKIRT